MVGDSVNMDKCAVIKIKVRSPSILTLVPLTLVWPSFKPSPAASVEGAL